MGDSAGNNHWLLFHIQQSWDLSHGRPGKLGVVNNDWSEQTCDVRRHIRELEWNHDCMDESRDI